MCLFTSNANADQTAKPRVIVMTDGEVDDRCSMVRFLLYTNDVDLVAIIQTNSVYQGKGWSSSKWLEKEIEAYGQSHSNLVVHDPSYPSANDLKSKVLIGDEDPSHLAVDIFSNRRIPGTKPVIDPSGWADTPGSEKIVQTLLEDDPRPVYIQAWGGANTAAKAFYKLKKDYPSDYDRALSKAVLYNIWYQDGAGNYIEQYFPEVTMLLSFHFNDSWAYGTQQYTGNFVKDIVHARGALGALYVQNYISEGDSPAFLYSLPTGLRSSENPTFGGWGGIFYKVDGFKNVYRDYDAGSYIRWIEFANRDFETRLNWCLAGKYKDANHKPVISIKGGFDRIVKSGETVVLEAEISDKDSINAADLWKNLSQLYEQQGVDFKTFELNISRMPKFSSIWWHYKEAGTYPKVVETSDQNQNKISFVAPSVDKPETIHLIFQVTDKGSPALTGFARVIITVLPKKQ
ncbi:DUF1593 domain-containing protein [Draconibacterium sp.]